MIQFKAIRGAVWRAPKCDSCFTRRAHKRLEIGGIGSASEIALCARCVKSLKTKVAKVAHA